MNLINGRVRAVRPDYALVQPVPTGISCGVILLKLASTFNQVRKIGTREGGEK